MRVTAAEDLKAWSHITSVMVFFERTRADLSSIECHVAADHSLDILRPAPMGRVIAEVARA
jgi:hypothetical protein